MDSQVLLPTLVLSALDRVTSSATFARSERHRSLLRYLVEKTLDGRSAEIKESTVALEVFRRNSYDPQIDATVRVEMGKLRERLERYYASVGTAELLRIEIPRGSYVPVFRTVTTIAASETVVPPKPSPLHVRHSLGWAVVAAVIVAAIIIAMQTPARPPATADRTSIAVLPFLDLGAAKELDYFCSGITDQIIGDLASLQVLRVLPRTSVAQYRGPSADVRKIGRELNVHAVVEGRVRKEGSRVKIEVQLMDTRQGLLLWMDSFERDFDNILGIQREIAEATARAFNRTLFDTARALSRQQTDNNDAYHHYLRAAYFYTNDPPRSIEYYRAAIKADPAYALAWAGVAAGWIRLDEFEMAAPVKARQEALAAAAKAMSLDPELAEAQWVSGVVKLYYERDWHAAEKALLKAIELDGTHSRFRWEYPRLILIPTGRFGECVDQVQAAIALEPVNPTLYNLLANCYIKGRQYNEAVPYLEASRKLAVGVSAVVLQGMVAAGQGHWQQALDRFEEASRMRRSTWVLGHLGYTLAKIGRTDAARKIAAEMEARGERGFRPHFDLAVVYAALGEKDMAIESLQRTFDVFSPNILWLKVDYRLDDLRGHPRFAEIVRAVGLAP